MRTFITLAAVLSIPAASYPQTALLPPPKVVAANPGFWARDVSPSTDILSLSFDQPMRPGFSAWAGPSALLPDEFGTKERFSADLKSLGLDVKLSPGTVYVFGINERGKSGVGFQNAQGTSVAPHFLVFQTTGQPSPEKSPPALTGSTPKNFAMEVDPSENRTLTFSFDRPMHRDSHGVILAAAGSPVDLSSVPFTWDDSGQTLTLSYPLRPNILYRATLNSISNIGFRSGGERIPLWPVTLTFRTIEPSVPEPPESAPRSVADNPPSIIKASPGFWETGIDPALDRLTLEFDQPLRAGFSAWTGPGSIVPDGTVPESPNPSSGTDIYTSDFTGVSLPVKLQRGRIYVFALNGRSRPGVGFQNPKGLAMNPRYLVFRTSGIPPQELRPPEFRGMSPDPKEKISLLNGVAKIRLSFDRPMNQSSHGLEIRDAEGIPSNLTDVVFSWDKNATSLELEVPLKSGGRYSAQLNSDLNVGFRTSNNIPLWPLNIPFETSSP